MSDHVVKTWTVENSWKCTSCGQVNRGRDMKCPNCGSAREKPEEEIVSAPDAPVVTDPELLKKANQGAHWVCRYCSAQERALNGTCANCGAKVDEGAPPPRPTPSRMAPPRGDSVPQSYAAVLASRAEATGRIRAAAPPPRSHAAHIVGITAAVLLALGVVSVVIAVFVPHEVRAKVTKATWKHTSYLRERQVQHGSGWGSPLDSFNVVCQRRFKENVDCHAHNCRPHSEKYQCGSHDCNCRDSCTSNKNGFSSCRTTCSTCADYCSRTAYDTCYDQCAVYADWCEYDHYVWPVIEQQTASGEGQDTRWPPLAVRGEFQRLEQTAAYAVEFGEGDDVWKLSPAALAEYKTYVVGDEWKIKVNRVGQVWPLGKMSGATGGSW